MESGDGLLVRVRVRARGDVRGILASHVRALAQLAAEHGNGLLEVTRRARLQVRGVRAESLAALQRAVVELGLAAESAQLERSADALIVNPWSGLSPECAQLDALAAELESELARTGVCDGASDKLAIVLDSGYALTGIAADIHVNIDPHTAERAQIHVSTGAARWSYLGECGVANVTRIVLALLSALRDARDCKRMRELVESAGLDAVRELASSEGLVALPQGVVENDLVSTNETERSKPRPTSNERALAHSGTGADDAAWLELALPFGSGDRTAWDRLADLAERYGSGEVRITPFRSVIVTGVAPTRRTAALQLADAAGWITDPSDPLLRVAACPGAPACSSAQGETRTVGRELAPMLGAGESLHVSGCSKGCAQSSAASVTVVRRADGCHLGFGLDAAQTAETPQLSIHDARAALARRSPTSTARTLARDPSNLQARELRQQ